MPISTQEFELLLKANRILSSTLDINNVLHSVLELATEVVHAEASALLLLDEKKNELYFDVALGSAKESVKEIRLKVGEGIAGWVAQERKPLIVNDVTQDKRFTQRVDKSTKFNTRSILAVPLLTKGKMVGVIEAINKKEKKPFLESDREVFEIFANQSAVAIENARLFSEVTHEKEKLDLVFSQMQEGVLLLDNQGDILLINQKGERLLGLAPNKVVGQQFGKKIFPDFDSGPSWADIEKNKSGAMAFDLVRTKGKDLFIGMFGQRLESGGFIFVLRDLTEQKKGERLKSDFLSLMSHKLKTPLTVIMGYAPILASDADKLEPMQQKAVEAIGIQAENLAGLVDKLLSFSIVESVNLDQKREEKSLSAMLNGAISHLRYVLDSVHGVVELSPEVSKLPPLRVDENLTIEVFRNIIENGVKFNNQKEKKIIIKGTRDGQLVSIEFIDNGVGIPPEEFEKIFEKFYQVENSFTGQVPGAGLGLAMCKKVVEGMGGKITVQSKVGTGSNFRVLFPVS